MFLDHDHPVHTAERCREVGTVVGQDFILNVVKRIRE